MLSTFRTFVLGDQMRAQMPSRVLKRIADQQVQSEKLISWVQLFIVFFFTLLWLVAPSSASQDAFNLVPWALGVYTIFTLVRMIGAYQARLSRTFLMASVILDIGLLMALIWSFHLQYEQPPSFYLKAPTLMYVFIFISLRALRFEPGYIIMAGASAAVGWAVLVGFVLFTETGHSPVTRDYITYITSNSVLIGAEVDKIVSIIVVTGILAIGVMRAERVLSRSISESVAHQDLSRFVSPEVAERIVSSDRRIRPGDGESKEASIVFTDLEGFSTISEKMSPNELAQTLNEYFCAMGAIIEKYGGVINQFEGDAMLITYNAVTPVEDHANVALRAAIEMNDLVQQHTFGDGIVLKTRFGINTGDVVIGAIGTEARLTYTVHGDAVNVAARLEQLNKEYGTYIMVTEDTMTAAGPGYDAAAVGDITVRGRAQPTRVYAVSGLAAKCGPLPPRRETVRNV